jgi:hypothetical protein
MMLGEVDFATVFADGVTHDGISPSLRMPYPPITLLLCLLFACVMSIIVMNLLVSTQKHCQIEQFILHTDIVEKPPFVTLSKTPQKRLLFHTNRRSCLASLTRSTFVYRLAKVVVLA